MFKTKDAWMNFAYSIGASVVILGALFKMTHWHLGFITGNVALAGGLITEAIIFLIFAFDPPKSEESYAWENVYPELLDKNAKPNPRHSTVSQAAEIKELETSLSGKLDKMLEEAKLDVGLFERLRSGIDKFSESVDQINRTVDVTSATQKYTDQLTVAATHLESINALFAMQIDHGKTKAEYNKLYVENIQKSAEQSVKFNEELEGLTSNLNNLNRVYGGMLNVMKS